MIVTVMFVIALKLLDNFQKIDIFGAVVFKIQACKCGYEQVLYMAFFKQSWALY